MARRTPSSTRDRYLEELLAMPDLRFTPVPMLRRRAGGWSCDAQHAFVIMLARTGLVAHAARSVGCSPRSAYQLRAKAGAEGFAAAWDLALEMGRDAALCAAARALSGMEERPLIRRGRQVGTVAMPNHTLGIAALRAIAAERDRAFTPRHRQRMWEREAILLMEEDAALQAQRTRDLQAAEARARGPTE